MDTKAWYLSKTVWASVLVVILGALSAFKVSQIGAVQVENVQQNSDAITDMIINIVTAVVGVIALYGRLTAKTVLTKTSEKADES